MTIDQASFLHLVADLRPELHRYCARMTGSVIDGEDLLQDTLLKAFSALPPLAQVANVRAWVFRLAHNQAVDRWRSYEQRSRTSPDVLAELPDVSDFGAAPDDVLSREQTLNAALSRFLELPPLQRSCVILKDVLDYSLDDIAGWLSTTVPAVQAALHRARRRLSERRRAASEAELDGTVVSPTLIRYAALFNARDWDALRNLLLDDVRLDVVARFSKMGRRDVGSYFGNYAKMSDWRVAPGLLDQREVLAVFRADPARLSYFIEVTVEGEHVRSIRDFHHVPYVANEARVALATRV
ncbi:MAG TPA: RNA polymerase sigma factor [Polyangiaceae bacterium]|nr:RNA polymerase sigma factor [Polyangiaceae bacterium]